MDDNNVHKHSSFKHSCIHPPRHPKSHQPTPHFERLRLYGKRGSTGGDGGGRRDELVSQASNQGGFVHELGSKRGSAEVGRLSQLNRDSDDDDDDENDDLFNASKKSLNIIDAFERENSQFRSMSDFYDSIPDYNDLHHLSESEFYSRLERLKIQQQELMDLVGATEPSTKPGNKKLDSGPHLNMEARKELIERAEPNQEEDCNSNSVTSQPYGIGDHNLLIKRRPTSSVGKTKKSVRISSGTTYRTDDMSDFNDCEEFIDERLRLNVTNTRSKSASPRRTKAVTVPKPFKMTQRWGQTFITRKSEQEEKMMDDLACSSKYLSKISLNFNDHQPEASHPKVKPFRANPVPITSRIPLYEHIKEDHRRRSALAKLNSAIELQAQIKPFKFNSGGGDRPSRCLSRTASTPNLVDASLEQQPNLFKANPCPKRLFSNYFYNKMWEDEYFRAINRKIRAEEMLKISSLPPSMAKRNQGVYSEFDSTSKSNKRRRKRKCKKTIQQKSFAGAKRTSGVPSNSSIVSSSCETTPIPSSYPVNRPNLAATLRVQSARHKVRELSKPKSLVPENRLTSTSRCSQSKNAWGVRKSPAWKSMNYDPTNTEDIAIRVATRKAEQKLRQEEHEISMELMKQRVRAAPLLLEGPTYWGPKVGQLSHRCRSTDDITSPTIKSRPTQRQNHSSSKLSFYSADHHGDALN